MAWEAASQKYVREYGDLLAQAASGSSLVETERDLLRGILRFSPVVVHLQSGHGLDDVALVQAGAKSVVGIDYSQVAVRAAQRRADELGIACRYVPAAVPGVPLASASADLVYTGKGALVWMAGLAGWAREVARLLRPSGHLFVYEAHPAVILWTWDEDRPGIREDRSYFGRSHVNDTFPGSRGGGMAVDPRRDHHRCGSGRHGDPAPRRVPGTILACGRCRRGGVGRAAAELLRFARPPGAVNGGCPVLPRSLPLVSR